MYIQSKNLEEISKLTDSLIDRDFLLKRRQFIYEKILEFSPIQTFVWAIDMNFKFIHTGGCLPYANIYPDDDFLNTTVFDFFGIYSKEISPIREISLGLESCIDVSYSIKYNDRMLFTICTPLKNYSDSIVGLIGITYDITEILNMKFAIEKLSEKNDTADINTYIRIINDSLEKIRCTQWLKEIKMDGMNIQD